MMSAEVAVVPFRRIAAQRAGAVATGVFAAFPSFLVPGVADGGGPRTTDLLNLGCAALLAVAVFRGRLLGRWVTTLLLVGVLTLPWVAVEIANLAGSPDPPVQRLLVRWILCGCTAYWVVGAAGTPETRRPFLLGLLVGTGCSSLTLLNDFLTFSPEDMPIEQLVNLAIYDGKDIHDFIYRAFGIFGHPNGAAGCVLVAVPVAIGLVEERRAPSWLAWLALLLVGGVFYLTKSRGPLIVCAGLFTWWGWSAGARNRAVMIAGAAVAALALVAAGGFGQMAGAEAMAERFLDLNSIGVNAGDRWWTIASSLELMVQNPLGLGSAYVDPLEIATGTSATHNAYLELALMGGIPLAAFVAARLLRLAVRLLDGVRPVETWLAAYLLGIFAFESFFLQVNMPLLTLWLVATPSAAAMGSRRT